MSVTFTGIGTGTATANATSQALATTGALAVGDIFVIMTAFDNSGTSGADPMSGTLSAVPVTGALGPSLSAQAGLNDPGVASAGLAMRVLAYPVTTAIPSGTTINMAWSGTVAVRTFVFAKVSSTAGAVVFRTNSGATGANTVAATTLALTTPSVTSGEMVLCWAGQENGAVLTGDADTTNGTWSAVYGTFQGSGATGMASYFQNKVVTATATQTFNPTSATSSDWIAGCLIFTETVNVAQASYRWYADGTETASTTLVAQDTQYNFLNAGGDVNVGLRVRMQITGTVVPVSTDDWQLQYDKNASGSWTNVATTGSNVLAFNSASLTDAAATTNRLGAGTGSFVAGKVSKDGLLDDLTWTANNYTEMLYSLTLKATDVARGDVLTFRVLRNAATSGITYTVTPSILVGAPASPPVATLLKQQVGNIGKTNSSGSVTPTTGSFLTVRAMWNNGGGTAGTCTVADTAGNTWVTTNQIQTSGAAGAGVFYCLSHIGGSTNITVTNSNTGDMMMACLYESWPNIASVGAKGTNTGDVNPPNDLVVTMTGTAPGFDDVVIGAMSFDEFTNPSTLQAIGQYSADYTGIQVSTAGGQWMLYLASKRVGSTSLSYVFDYLTGDEFGEAGVALTLVKAAGGPVETAGYPNVWTGSNWVGKPVKVWNGTTWQQKPMKVWTGSTWALV